MTTVLIIAAIFAIGIFLFWGVGLWPKFLGSLAIFIGGWELVSIKLLDESMSQSFWAYHLAHPVMGWVTLAFAGLVCCVWLVHMGVKGWKAWRKS